MGIHDELKKLGYRFEYEHGDSEESPALLIAEPPAQNLCLDCHDEQESLVEGPHDFRLKPDAWPQASREQSNRCLACHRLHADEESQFFTNGLAAGLSGPDAICLACHPQAGWGSDGAVAALHAREATDLAPDDEDLPLVPADAEDEYRIGCRTCHNPHQGAGPPTGLVRAADDEPTAALCALCHDGTGYIGMTCHSSASLKDAGLPAGSCRPCHKVHGNPDDVATPLLWGAGTNPAGRLPDERRCLGCHRTGGPARPPATAAPPAVPMSGAIEADRDSPGFLPLFDEQGAVDPRGRISCLTCHVPHGRAPGPADSPDVHAASLSPARRRAMRLELRRFVMPNVCTTCHGLDALRYFLYFHDPQRRGGRTTRGGP